MSSFSRLRNARAACKVWQYFESAVFFVSRNLICFENFSVERMKKRCVCVQVKNLVGGLKKSSGRSGFIWKLRLLKAPASEAKKLFIQIGECCTNFVFYFIFQSREVPSKYSKRYMYI